jgi:hypothetical protein
MPSTSPRLGGTPPTTCQDRAVEERGTTSTNVAIASIKPRRSHRKSRTGCAECRKRRVKVCELTRFDLTVERLFLTGSVSRTDFISCWLANSATRRGRSALHVHDGIVLASFLQALQAVSSIVTAGTTDHALVEAAGILNRHHDLSLLQRKQHLQQL